MKKIILLLLTCPTVLLAQEKYNISGKMAGVNAQAKIFLIYDIGTQHITDSAAIKDGEFKLFGQVSTITQATLVMDHTGSGIQGIISSPSPDVIPVFLEQGTIKVSVSDSLSKGKISGTKTNDDYALYKAIAKPINDSLKALNIAYNAAPAEKKNSEEFIAELQRKQIVIQQQAKDMNSRFITGHPDSYVGLQVIKDALNQELYPDAVYLQAQFSKLSKYLRESKTGLSCQRYLDQLTTVAIGAIAPDFAQPDTNGKPVKLSSFRGQYVLIDFWASWCGPCRKENPNLVKAYQKYRGKNFTILSVSLDQSGKKDDWLNAIHSDRLNWNHLSDLKSWGNAAALLYGVRAIPQNLLIDPSGKIIAKNIFGDDLQNKLAELLGKI